jgi:hypothetical protein
MACVGLSGGSWTNDPSFADESNALFSYWAGIGDLPDATRRGHINTLIAGLKSDGNWTSFDLLYVMAAHSEVAARTNWKSPGDWVIAASANHTYTVDRGFTGNGSGNLSTGFDLGVNGVNYTRNSAHAAVRMRTAGAADTSQMFFQDATDAANQLRIDPARADGRFLMRINQTPNTSTTTSFGAQTGHFLVNRSGASATQAYRNGSAISLTNNTNAASEPVPAGGTPLVLSLNTTLQINAAHIGSSRTSGEAANINTRLNTYMTAVGA